MTNLSAQMDQTYDLITEVINHASLYFKVRSQLDGYYLFSESCKPDPVGCFLRDQKQTLWYNELLKGW
jgi:hypothetical protein